MKYEDLEGRNNAKKKEWRKRDKKERILRENGKVDGCLRRGF